MQSGTEVNLSGTGLMISASEQKASETFFIYQKIANCFTAEEEDFMKKKKY